LSLGWRQRPLWRTRLGGFVSWGFGEGGGGREEKGGEGGCRGRTGKVFLPDGLEVDFDAEAFSDAVEAA
jgi:hypothetical protein